MLDKLRKVLEAYKKIGKIKKILVTMIVSTFAIYALFFGAAFVSAIVDASKNPNVSTEAQTTEPTTITTTEQTNADPTATTAKHTTATKSAVTTKINSENISEYHNNPYVIINNNQPNFSKVDQKSTSFESYSPLDSKGRCGVAYACIGKDLMPTEERGKIGSAKPSGWHTVKYAGIDGNYLYNRCHLIGWQLTGENANEKNLITGTRYMNVEGMLPFENMVADYIEETGNHVLYRATPIFKGDNLLASGVQIEAYSIEDNGDGICFNVYCYNVQPGITINYSNGSSSGPSMTETAVTTTKATTKPITTQSQSNDIDYILNLNSKKFHYPHCNSVKKMSEENKGYFKGTRDDAVRADYEPCGNCNP